MEEAKSQSLKQISYVVWHSLNGKPGLGGRCLKVFCFIDGTMLNPNSHQEESILECARLNEPSLISIPGD